MLYAMTKQGRLKFVSVSPFKILNGTNVGIKKIERNGDKGRQL